MAATSSEAASKAHDTSLLLALIQQYCRKFDEDSLPIWVRLKQFPQFSHEAECPIEGAMQDPAEPPSAADAEPPEAPDAEPPLLADLAQEFLEAPEEAPEAQADVCSDDWLLTDQFEETPEAPPGPPSSEYAEPTEFLEADANWDGTLPGMASSDTTSEAEQISEAQSSQPADQHSLQHQQHKREKSANWWRHNTPTTGAAAERRNNKRKHSQMNHPERRTLHNEKKKVRQTFNNLWATMFQRIAEHVGLPQQDWGEKDTTDFAVTMEEQKAGIALVKKLDKTFGGVFGISQH